MLPVVRVDGLIAHTIGWTIDVIVVRLWRQFDDNRHSIIKMICNDEQGSKIVTTIKHRDVERYSDRIKQGDWKMFSMFNVIPITGILGTPNTVVRSCLEVQPWSARLSQKSDSAFVDAPSISDIQHFMVEEDVLTVVIGFIASDGCLRSDEYGNRTLKFLLIDENDYVIECTACGSIADRFSELWLVGGSTSRICLLRFWMIEQKCIIFPGCSEFVFNPAIPEAENFRNRYHLMADQGSIVDRV